MVTSPGAEEQQFHRDVAPAASLPLEGLPHASAHLCTRPSHPSTLLHLYTPARPHTRTPTPRTPAPLHPLHTRTATPPAPLHPLHRCTPAPLHPCTLVSLQVVSRSSLSVSCQVSLEDTAATQGALEVVPGTQAYDSRVSDRERLTDPKYAQLSVAVPAGTVAVYMLHLMHRGGANTHSKERPFYFFTLMGRGIAPPGLAYTMQLDDIGRFGLRDGRVVEGGAA